MLNIFENNKSQIFLRIVLVMGAMLIFATACNPSTIQSQNPRSDPMSDSWKKLTPEEQSVIVGKGTEMPFKGEYVDTKEKGVYKCKRCGHPLFNSDAKFDSGTGWPSFDEAIPGAVKRIPDADGHRVEIVCSNCDSHLGHLFENEGFSEKNKRFCSNSISLDFQSASDSCDQSTPLEYAYFAGGCFWGVEYHFENLPGVVKAESGYMGGDLENPTYYKVLSGKTGHVESVRVTYDPTKTTYEKLARLFFEIHDPTQTNGQGLDIGNQYLSYVFYANPAQKKTTEDLIAQLKAKGYKVSTRLQQAKKFYPAEDYHQDYYEKKQQTPYCHIKTKRFN